MSTTTTTEELGGCAVDSTKDTCTGDFTERDCLKMTTTTTDEPGCCRSVSYKAQAKC